MTSEVSGRTILGTLEQMMSVFRRRIEESLTEFGITDVEAEAWYSADDFARVLAMVERDAGRSTVTKLGAVAPETMEWVGNPTTVAEGLTNLSRSHQSTHRGAVGHYDFEQTGEDTGRIVCDTPYPCEFDKGVLKGTMKRFGGQYPKITEDTHECRDDGGSTCTYTVSW
jgi:hypothetical protein